MKPAQRSAATYGIRQITRIGDKCGQNQRQEKRGRLNEVGSVTNEAGGTIESSTPVAARAE